MRYRYEQLLYVNNLILKWNNKAVFILWGFVLKKKSHSKILTSGESNLEVCCDSAQTLHYIATTPLFLGNYKSISYEEASVDVEFWNQFPTNTEGRLCACLHLLK